MITMSRLKPDKMSGPCCRALFGHPAKCQLPGRQQNIIIIMCGLCWSSSPSPPWWPSPLLRPSRSPVWTDSPVTVQPLWKSHCQVHRWIALANLFFKSSMTSRYHYHLHRWLFFQSVWILLSQSYQAVVEKQDEPDLYVLQEFLPNWEPPQWHCQPPQSPVESLVKMH